jgi:2',3'-cyclic-nucleotide 2'-phosphodiesterase
MSITVAVLGEIVGKSGMYTVKAGLQKLKQQYGAEAVIANVEGATGGFGIGKNHSIYLRKLGIDALTTGEKTYFKKDMVEHLRSAPYIVRPANFPFGNPGRGWSVFDARPGVKIGVITLLGQAGFPRVHVSNPFQMLPGLIEKVKTLTPHVIVQFHAATTAEKRAMAFYADGKVSAVVGTHAKAITSDAQILPGKTAVITDNGRCGSLSSVGGLAPAVEIRKFLTQVPERSSDWWTDLELQGVIITLDDEGCALSIETVRMPIETPAKEAVHD